MSRRTRRSAKWAIHAALAGSVSLLTAASSPAFYFSGWPGDGIPKDKTLLTEKPKSTPDDPLPIPFSTEEDPRWTFGPGGDGPSGPGDPSNPPNAPNVPEPTTALMVLAGAATIGLTRLRKKSK